MARKKLTMKRTGNFGALVKKLSGDAEVNDPRAVAAAIGNRKFGKGQMQAKAARLRRGS